MDDTLCRLQRMQLLRCDSAFLAACLSNGELICLLSQNIQQTLQWHHLGESCSVSQQPESCHRACRKVSQLADGPCCRESRQEAEQARGRAGGCRLPVAPEGGGAASCAERLLHQAVRLFILLSVSQLCQHCFSQHSMTLYVHLYAHVLCCSISNCSTVHINHFCQLPCFCSAYSNATAAKNSLYLTVGWHQCCLQILSLDRTTLFLLNLYRLVTVMRYYICTSIENEDQANPC